MTNWRKIVLAATAVLLCCGLTVALGDTTPEEQTLTVAAKKKGKKKGDKKEEKKGDKKRDKKGGKRKDVRHDGHKLLSRDKMKQLKSGTHKIHSAHGHDVHARLKNGKVAGMHVKTPKGKTVNMKPRKNAPRKVALGQDEDAELIPVQMGGQIFFVFSGRGITIVISFPSSSVDPGIGGDNNDPDPDSTDPDSTDPDSTDTDL